MNIKSEDKRRKKTTHDDVFFLPTTLQPFGDGLRIFVQQKFRLRLYKFLGDLRQTFNRIDNDSQNQHSSQ
jgi:hypothetical protein